MTATQQAPSATRPLHDVRGFWRVLLGVFAPLPFLAKGLWYLLSPVDGDISFADDVAAAQAHHGMAALMLALDVVFCVGLIPATVAVVMVARRGAPRLAAAGAFLALLGQLVGFGLLGGPITPTVATVRYGLGSSDLAGLSDGIENDVFMQLSGLLFLVGIVFGLGLLGIALWRSKAAPAWAGIAILVGAGTHPFVPGHIGQGIGLLVACVGYAGAAMALQKLPNDAFDLAPARAS